MESNNKGRKRRFFDFHEVVRIGLFLLNNTDCIEHHAGIQKGNANGDFSLRRSAVWNGDFCETLKDGHRPRGAELFGVEGGYFSRFLIDGDCDAQSNVIVTCPLGVDTSEV